jgi:hypothetical protein
MWVMTTVYVIGIISTLLISGLLYKLNGDAKAKDIFWVVLNDLFSLLITVPAQIIIVYYGYKVGQVFLRDFMHVQTPLGHVANYDSIRQDSFEHVWILPFTITYSITMIVILVVTGVMKHRNKIAHNIFWKIIDDLRTLLIQLPAQVIVVHFGYQMIKHFMRDEGGGFKYAFKSLTNSTDGPVIEMQNPRSSMLSIDSQPNSPGPGQSSFTSRLGHRLSGGITQLGHRLSWRW